MVEFLRWTTFAVFGTLGGLMVIGNWFLIIGLLLKQSPRKPDGGVSFIPLGGLIAAVGCIVCPNQNVRSFAWLPVVLDPGTVIFVLLPPFIAWKSWRGNRSEV